eukprot:1737190-Amphidinium_carterae.1
MASLCVCVPGHAVDQWDCPCADYLRTEILGEGYFTGSSKITPSGFRTVKFKSTSQDAMHVIR